MLLEALHAQIETDVSRALREDIGDGDITATLIAEHELARAQVISREAAVICGRHWFDAVFAQLDARIEVDWKVTDGDSVSPGQLLCELTGPARALLSGERTALNFLQTLSGTATRAQDYASRVAGLETRVLDTRKTLPGLRQAQKYAVRCGGCHNHRMGLYDAFLIKENHIRAAGSIDAAVARARALRADASVEVEVENMAQLDEALAAGADRLLLDNFSVADTRRAVERTASRAELESSGGIDLDNLREYAATGVDFVSIGALTKDVRATDLSMRFV